MSRRGLPQPSCPPNKRRKCDTSHPYPATCSTVPSVFDRLSHGHGGPASSSSVFGRLGHTRDDTTIVQSQKRKNIESGASCSTQKRRAGHSSIGVPPKYLPFSDLCHLHDLSQRPPQNQIGIIHKRRSEFNEFLSECMILNDSDSESIQKVILLTKTLAKILSFQQEGEDNRISKLVCNDLSSSENQSYIHSLSAMLCQMPLEKNQAKRLEFVNFLEDVNLIFVHLLQKQAVSFSRILPVDVFNGSLKQLSSQEMRFQDLHKKSQNLIQQRDSIRADVYATAVDNIQLRGEPDYTALPTPEELKEASLPLDLDPNIVKGSFISEASYATIQYRLLREDFIHPLRCALHKLRVDDEEESEPCMTVYQNVRFNQGSTCLPGSGSVFRVSFEFKGLKHVKWDRSKRLTFGSLLCLSTDSFQKVLFATVAERNTDDLCKGIIAVKLVNNIDGFSLPPELPFEMIDSPGYYAAYSPVLKCLKNLCDKPSLLPFSKYLLCPSSRIPEVPEYLYKDGYLMNMQGIVCADGADCDHSFVDVSDEQSWSEMTTPLLDESQKAALYSALTRKLAIIQGPPGTGKSYIGVKIVQLLLKNDYHALHHLPIVVICYTNHALDQFLESLLEIKKMDEYKDMEIRRVGGRSKSEMVQHYNISNFVRVACRQRGLFTYSPQRLQQRVQALGEFLNGEYVPYNFKLYCSLLEQQTIHDFEFCFDRLCFRFWSTRFLCEKESGLLASWLSLDMLADVIEQHKFKQSQEAFNDYYFPHHAEDDRKIATEEDENGFLCDILNENIVKTFISMFKQVERLTAKEAKSSMYSDENVEQMPPPKRLALFKSCLFQLQVYLESSLGIQERKHRKYLEEKDLLMIRCLQQADVIGLTTTGAAKYNSTLAQIRAKTMIIEEAAEVLEAHVVACLTPQTDHLILIGDHKQLRPKTNEYVLARDYSLNISLFERLIQNNCHHNTLNIQHRMRPQIAEVVSNTIYDGCLQNGESVLRYSDIRGMKHNMFFVNHSEPENMDGDLKSPYNQYEAKYLARLCCYLLQQGYKPSDITVITPYTGQMFQIREVFKRRELMSQVRVTPIDSYQGEENEIILLSLVRSKCSGFVKDSNRICVALSRAKQGFYCIGNFELLSRESPVWSSIVKQLEPKELIGNHLSLKCVTHGNITSIQKLEDFDKVKDGGCEEKCNSRLRCNHMCPRSCHPDASLHEGKCLEPCPRSCIMGHRCKRKCYELCGSCNEQVEKLIPQCGHTEKVKCSVLPEKHVCQKECSKTLPCGHQCRKKCGEVCTKNCEMFVNRTWPCGHEAKVECCMTERGFLINRKCNIPCGTMLECGHKCLGTCGSCYQGRLHKKCQSKCGRQLVCGHICKSMCAVNCPPCELQCSFRCVHGPCGQKCKQLCKPCPHRCKWSCTHHKCTKNCGEMCDRPRCSEPCPQKLKCGHLCTGLCGEWCPSANGKLLCKVCDEKKWKELVPTIFCTEEDEDARFIQLHDCRHIFEVSSFDRYMDMESQEGQIKQKTCLTCKKPILRMYRYGNIVKQIVKDLNEIKKQNFHKMVENERKALCDEAIKLAHYFIKNQGGLDTYKKVVDNEDDITLKKNVVVFRAMEAIHQVRKIECPSLHTRTICLEEFLYKHRSSITNEMQSDVLAEVRRISILAKLYTFKIQGTESLCEQDQEFLTSTQNSLDTLQFGKATKLSEEEYQSLLSRLSEIAKKLKVPLTESEKRMIIGALHAKAGSWYKCPQGHFYQIGDCGGATVESVCPECDSKIGGQSHRLRADNSHAGEFDNSRHSAWSTGADLENYELINLV